MTHERKNLSANMSIFKIRHPVHNKIISAFQSKHLTKQLQSKQFIGSLNKIVQMVCLGEKT